MKNIIFCVILFTVTNYSNAQKLDPTGFLDMSSPATFWGSCFAVVRKEIQAKDPATQGIGMQAIEQIGKYGLYLQQNEPNNYPIFLREADKLNSTNIKAIKSKDFYTAFAQCVNQASKATKGNR